MIAKNPNDLTLINEKQTFLAYDKGSKENILFLGSCRMSPEELEIPEKYLKII